MSTRSRVSTQPLPTHRRSLVCALAMAGLLSAPGLSAAAEDDEVHQLVTPGSTIRLGVGHLSDQTPRLGMYSGMESESPYAVADVDIVRRDNATGVWLRLRGRNLGLDNRDARVEVERQGHWAFGAEYSRTVRIDPLLITTGLGGIGSATQAISAVTPLQTLRLSTKRDRSSLSAAWNLGDGFSVQANYRFEEKAGGRDFGRGTAQFLVEPVDSTTQLFELLANYVGERLQLQAGYLGSLFVSRPAVLDVNTGSDIALAPDNESHQFYVSGGYSLSPATRLSFKLLHGRGTQNEPFFVAPDFAGNLQKSLSARVDTTQASILLTARPLPALTVNTQLRLDDRDDRTPRYQFLAASTGRDGFNTPFSRRTSFARADAYWRTEGGLRLGAGVDWEERTRSVLAIRQASWRERNRETTTRLELRGPLSETLSVGLAALSSDRGGSEYLPANNNVAADYIDPIHFADRRREKLRLNLDWSPTDALSLQLLMDSARDRYDGRPLGPESGRAQVVSLDGSYTLSEVWQLHAWATTDDNRSVQSTLTTATTNVVTAQTWQARLRSTGEALGFGVRGRPGEKWDVGLDVMSARDRNEYRLSVDLPAAARLPDITTYRRSLRLYGSYALQRNLSLRVDLGLERFRSDDWTWTGWAYADGTTVTAQPRERASHLGIALVYRMW